MGKFKSITERLKKSNKTITETIEYLCDERRNLNLWKYKGNVMIKFQNGNQEKELFIDERIEPVIDKFLNE